MVETIRQTPLLRPERLCEMAARWDMEPLIVAGHDISDWHGVIGHRVLPDGRVLIVYKRMYNSILTVSTAQEWPKYWHDSW